MPSFAERRRCCDKTYEAGTASFHTERRVMDSSEERQLTIVIPLSDRNY
jgi:hypothetical protein